MSGKGSSSFDSCRTSGSGLHTPHLTSKTSISDEARGSTSSASVKPSEKCVYDSRLTDSGVWSGTNLHSEEISESPISKSGEFSYNSDKVSGDKGYMRLDSGIDVSVSQHFSELSLKDGDSCTDLNDLSSKSKATTSSSSKTNINERFSTSQKPPEPSLKKQTLLEQFFQQNEDGDTELHLTIIHKFIETVYALVRMVPHPKYLNIKNDDRQTPLHLAVVTHQPRLVRLLVCAGAALDVLDRRGNTPLHLAVEADDLACVRAIIDPINNNEILMTPLQYSPYQFHTYKDIANVTNYEGQTCVHLAALNGNIEILRYLLWYGANINAREWKGGQTCLHLAVARRDLALCKFLLCETVIDADEMTYAGLTAYNIAFCCGWDMNIAELLKEHGVDTYVESDIEDENDESDDEMLDIVENSYNNSYQMNGGGLVNVGA